MTQIVENKWNPVSLSAKNGKGYSITNYAVSSSWYNKVLDNSGNRRARLANFNEADCQCVELARALDMIAEDVSSTNADDEDIFKLDIPEEFKIKKTSMTLLNSMKEVWQKRTEMERKMFHRVRRTLKYGATFYRRMNDGSLKEYPTERMIGYILSEDDEDAITHYIYNPKIPRIDTYGRNFTQHNQASLGVKASDAEVIPVEELVILKIGEGPYGQSLVDTVYTVWKQMSMLESAVVIYRVVRAPERRVYYIDVGNLQGPKREAAIERQRIRLMQKQANRKGELHAEYDPHSTTEDIFIPTNSSGKGSRVETLQGGQSLGEMADVAWFAKKMAAGLRIPSSMIDIQGDQQNQYSDMRVGQVYQVEMRYMGFVSRIQRDIEWSLEKHFRWFCNGRDVLVPEEMNMVIQQSMSFALYKEIEINQTLLNVYNSTTNIPFLSKRYAMKKYMNMTEEELHANEMEILIEKGLPEKVAKQLTDEEVSNIVYGNAKMLEKYGVQVPEEEQQGY